MLELPDEIVYKIYVYGGANIFYLNKSGLKYIQNLRLEFLEKPIQMYYTISLYEKRIIFSNNFLNPDNWKVKIIKKDISKINTFKLWRGKIGKYKLENNGYNFYIYNSFKKKLIDEKMLVTKDYFKDKSNKKNEKILLGKKYDINDIWCYDNRLFKYIELWS